MEAIKVYLIIVLCLTHIVGFTQSLDAGSYEKAMDYFECSCVKIAEKEKVGNLDCELKESIVRIRQMPLGKNTKDLMGEIKGLRKSINQHFSKSELSDFLTVGLLINGSNGYQRIYDFAHKKIEGRERDIDILKEQLTQYINDLQEDELEKTASTDFAVSQQEEVVAVPPKLEKDVSQKTSAIPQHANVNEASFFTFSLNLAEISLAVLVIVICLLYVGKVKGDFNHRFSRMESKLSNNPNYQPAIRTMQREIDELEVQIKELKNRQPIESPEIGHEEESREVFLEVQKRQPPEPVPIPIEPSERIFYMPAPNEDGSFDVSSSSEVKKPLATLYEFKIHPVTPYTASFSFSSDDNGMKKALSNPRQNITPVCYEENDAFGGMQRIIQMKSGIAQKEGDKWIVTPANKAHIRYE